MGRDDDVVLPGVSKPLHVVLLVARAFEIESIVIRGREWFQKATPIFQTTRSRTFCWKKISSHLRGFDDSAKGERFAKKFRPILHSHTLPPSDQETMLLSTPPSPPPPPQQQHVPTIMITTILSTLIGARTKPRPSWTGLRRSGRRSCFTFVFRDDIIHIMREIHKPLHRLVGRHDLPLFLPTHYSAEETTRHQCNSRNTQSQCHLH